jgi:hypothetical protein
MQTHVLHEVSYPLIHISLPRVVVNPKIVVLDQLQPSSLPKIQI